MSSEQTYKAGQVITVTSVITERIMEERADGSLVPFMAGTAVVQRREDGMLIVKRAKSASADLAPKQKP